MSLLKRLALSIYGPLIFIVLCVLGGIFGRAAWFRDWYLAQLSFWASHLLRALSVEILIDDRSRQRLREREFEIVAASHKSHLDSVVLWAVYPAEKHLRFVAKQELFEIPFLGTGLDAAGAISINRKQGRESLTLLRDAVFSLKPCDSLLIFPEGTRTRGVMLGKFKKGAFLLAAESGRDLLPICIKGTHALMPPGRNLPGSGVVEVEVLPPRKVSGKKTADIDAAAKLLWNDMNQAMGRGLSHSEPK